MEPTIEETNSHTPRHQYYPPMTGKERLEALRSIRGMWKGQAQDILKRIEEGREDRELPTEKD